MHVYLSYICVFSSNRLWFSMDMFNLSSDISSVRVEGVAIEGIANDGTCFVNIKDMKDAFNGQLFNVTGQ